jgi:hypothetical protein
MAASQILKSAASLGIGLPAANAAGLDSLFILANNPSS